MALFVNDVFEERIDYILDKTEGQVVNKSDKTG
jgi:hypothetical protein